MGTRLNLDLGESGLDVLKVTATIQIKNANEPVCIFPVDMALIQNTVGIPFGTNVTIIDIYIPSGGVIRFGDTVIQSNIVPYDGKFNYYLQDNGLRLHINVPRDTSYTQLTASPGFFDQLRKFTYTASTVPFSPRLWRVSVVVEFYHENSEMSVEFYHEDILVLYDVPPIKCPEYSQFEFNALCGILLAVVAASVSTCLYMLLKKKQKEEG